MEKISEIYESWTARRAPQEFMPWAPENHHWDNRTSPRQACLALKGICSSSIDGDGLYNAKQAKYGGGEDYAWLDDKTLGTSWTQARRGKAWEEKATLIQA